MPFVKENIGGLTPQSSVAEDVSVDQDFGYLFDNEVKATNPISRIADALYYASESDNYVDPDFDPFTDDLIEGRMAYLDEIGQARNRGEAERIVARIDRELQQRSLMESTGVEGVLASLSAGLLDPINLVPVTAGGKFLYQVGRYAKAGKLARSGAIMGGAAGVGQEAIAQQTRLTQTMEESLFNVGAMTVLGAALGGFTGLLSKVPADRLAEEVAKEARDYSLIKSIGSAQSVATTFEQETLASAANMEKFFKGQDPILRTAQSESLEARRILQDLADVPMIFNKNKEGIAQSVPVFTRMQMYEADLDMVNAQLYDLYSNYRVGRSPKFGEAPIQGLRDLTIGAPEGKMTFAQFREEVGRAMRRGDSHQIPQVAEAAKLFRERVFNVHRDEAVRLGKLPVGVEPDTAISYFSRLYNKEKVKAQRPQFEERLVAGFRKLSNEITGKLDNAQKQAKIARETAESHKPRRDELQKEIAGYTQKEVKAASRRKAVERDIKAYRAFHSKAQTRVREATRRMQEVTPSQADKEFITAIRDLKKGIPKSRRPYTLSEFIRSKGGIRDFQGEVKALGEKKLINNKSGMTLDDAALFAWERGFFPEHPERIDINTFLEALRDDISGGFPRIDPADAEKVYYAEYLQSLDEELAKRGIDITKLQPEEVQNLLAIGKKGVKQSDKNFARLRESEYALKRAERDAEELAGKLAAKQKELDELTATSSAFSKAIREVKALHDDVDLIIRNNEEKAGRWDEEANFTTYLAGADDAELRMLASDIVDGMLGLSPQEYAFGVPVARGALKKRTIPIPDADLEDFLVSDIFEISRRYNHTMASDLLLTEKFGRADMEPAIFKIREEYRAMRDAMVESGTADEKAMKAISASEKQAIKDIEAMRDRIRGTYALPKDMDSLLSRSFQVAKGVNYMRLMGGMQLSAAPDIGRVFAADKMANIFKDTLIPMVRDFKQFRLAAEEAKLAGVGLDMINNDRTLALAGLDDAWHGRSKFERGLQAMQDNYKFVSLMAPWNAALKQLVAVIGQTRSLRWFERLAAGEAIPQDEITRLARYGIDKEMAGRIWQQVNRHGKKKSGIWWANTSQWEDKEAVLRYRAAMNREANNLIVTPGLDKPLWMSTELGSVVGQFKSFGVAATQRMVISGLQERSANQLNGFLISTMLGMLVFAMKAKPEEIENASLEKWIFEGVDRSGSLAWLMDAHNIFEKVTGWGINSAMGQQGAQRYASRGAVSAALGPTFGLIAEEVLPTIGAITRGKADQYTLHNMRQMMPYQNLYYTKWLFDALEQGGANALGVQPLQ